MAPSYWQDATNYLTRTYEVMAGLIVSYPDAVLQKRSNPLQTLMRAVGRYPSSKSPSKPPMPSGSDWKHNWKLSLRRDCWQLGKSRGSADSRGRKSAT
jgi:hypothetical protein